MKKETRETLDHIQNGAMQAVEDIAFGCCFGVGLIIAFKFFQ